MASHYDAVLAAIPAVTGGGFVVDQVTGAVVPSSGPFGQLPLTAMGLVSALLIIGYELANPPGQ